MKSMVALSVSILKEIGDQTGISTARDEITLISRSTKEGLSFLTITLPSFESDLMSALNEGEIGLHHFLRFKREKSGKRPIFLGAFLRSLFSSDGLAIYDVDPRLVGVLRQFLLAFKKVEMECSDKRVDNAYQNYIAEDRSLPDIPSNYLDAFSDCANWLFRDYLLEVEKELFSEFVPRYSSGALATRESFNERFSSRVWTDRLEDVVPCWDVLFTGARDWVNNPVTYLERHEETPSRVIHVPKTLKTPRIIAMEPSWNQFIQQGVLSKMSEVLSRRQHHALWYGFCWQYQDFNRLLAKIGSETKSLATIDLSSASDRVSLPLVRDGLLRRSGYLREISLASRSEVANVRGVNITLRKFASMGSALTFPFETMIFYTIVHLAWKELYGAFPSSPLTPDQGVRVYGDDIIVPVRLVPYVYRLLEAFGLKVNPNKSFFGEFSFRESCGGDYLNGVDITPCRLKSELGNIHLGTNLSSIVSFRNGLYSRGYSDTVRYLDRIILRSRYVPYGPATDGGVHLWTDKEEYWKSRVNPDLQRLEYKTLRPRLVKPSDSLNGYGALLKFKIPHAERESDHLIRDGRANCVGYTVGWLAAG